MKKLILALILVVVLTVSFATPAFAYPPPESGKSGLNIAKDAQLGWPHHNFFYGKALGIGWGFSVIQRLIQGYSFPPGNPSY